MMTHHCANITPVIMMFSKIGLDWQNPHALHQHEHSWFIRYRLASVLWCMLTSIRVTILIWIWFSKKRGLYNNQSSTKALEKWGYMTHTIEKYGDICKFSGVTYVILPFVNIKFVGTWAVTVNITGDIPDFNVLNVPKMQPRHNPE